MSIQAKFQFYGLDIYPKKIPKEYENIPFKKVWEELIDIDTLLFMITILEKSINMKLSPKYAPQGFFEKLTLMYKIVIKRLESE